MNQTNYTLKQLCLLSDVTARTVRYYIEKGLLPPPQGVKSQSTYGPEHVVRLQIIRQLKERFLPLDEIKKILEGRSLTQLETLAADLSRAAEDDKDEQDDVPLVRDYSGDIGPLVLPRTSSGAFSFSPVNQAFGFTTSKERSAQPPASPFFQFVPAQPDDAPSSEVEQALQASWVRLPIAPGLELQVNRALAEQHPVALQELLDLIRKWQQGKF